MDLATLLARVDARQYRTVESFLAALALIPAAEKQFYGDDPEGIQEVNHSPATMHCPLGDWGLKIHACVHELLRVHGRLSAALR